MIKSFLYIKTCLFFLLLFNTNVSAQVVMKGNYKLPLQVKYLVNADSSYLSPLVSTFYPIGWSRDGKIAYIEEPADEACGCYFFRLVIQDLNTNKVVWKWNFTGEESGNENLKGIWEKNKKLFTKKLVKSKIEQTNFKTLSNFPVQGDKNKYTVKIKPTMFNSNDFGLIVKQTQFFKYTNGKNKKLITTKYHTQTDPQGGFVYGFTLSAKIQGFLKSPFENRVAIFYQIMNRGYEGPPHVLQYELIGLKL